MRISVDQVGLLEPFWRSVFVPLPDVGEAALATPMRAIRTMRVRGAKRSELPLTFDAEAYLYWLE